MTSPAKGRGRGSRKSITNMPREMTRARWACATGPKEPFPQTPRHPFRASAAALASGAAQSPGGRRALRDEDAAMSALGADQGTGDKPWTGHASRAPETTNPAGAGFPGLAEKEGFEPSMRL